MQSLHVNGYDMPYLDVGEDSGRPLVCVHGSLNDFRVWGCVLGLLPKGLHALAAHVPYSTTAIIPNATHPMFEQAPQKFSEVVLEFLAG